MTVSEIVLTIIVFVLGGLLIYLAIDSLKQTAKYKALKAENKALIAQYEPIRQAEAMKKTAPDQIQDISDNGKKLLQTIVDLLKDQHKMLDGILRLPIAQIPAPAPDVGKVSPAPPKAVTKKKSTNKQAAKTDKGA